jgi:hypothetical protein
MGNGNGIRDVEVFSEQHAALVFLFAAVVHSNSHRKVFAEADLSTSSVLILALYWRHPEVPAFLRAGRGISHGSPPDSRLRVTRAT